MSHDPTRDFGHSFMQHLAALSEWFDPVTVAAYFDEIWALWCDGLDARETGETILAAMPNPSPLSSGPALPGFEGVANPL